MTTWRICSEELQKLPDNNKFTHNYCERFSSVFLCDGKYFSVADKKHDWVLLWIIDYFRHDIPVFIIAPSESYHSWAKVFSIVRIINHFPQLVVCDDNVNIKMAVRDKFPSCRIQTCYTHFKENIRRSLKVRSDNTYKPFMNRIDTVFNRKRTDADMYKKLSILYAEYQHDPVCVSVLTNMQRYHAELIGYRGIKNAPVTTNLIEGMNGHLQARLQALRSFQSVKYARLWLNGYILKRRFTKWTDCRGKFKKLNGKTGVEMTKKHGVDVPLYF